MAAPFETGTQPRIDDRFGHALTDNTLAETEDIGIIVHARHLRRVGIVAECRTNTVVAVGRHAHTDTRTADQHTLCAGFAQNVLTHFHGKVGVVDTVAAERAKVNHFVTFLLKQFTCKVFEIDSGVVGSNIKFHCHPL